MSLTLASKVKFKEFCDVLDKISKAAAAEKYGLLEQFIKQCRILGEKIKSKDEKADISLFPIMRLLLPQHEHDRGSYGLKETALAKLYVRVLCLGKSSQDTQKLLHYKAPASGKQIGGDFAEVAYWILRRRLQDQESSMTIQQVNEILDNIAMKNANNQSKDGEFQDLIQQLNAVEHKWLIRILLKDLRIGLSTKKILRGLSFSEVISFKLVTHSTQFHSRSKFTIGMLFRPINKDDPILAYHSDAVDLFEVTTSVHDVCVKLQNPKSRMKYGIELFSPFKPMLLEKCKIEDVGKFFTGQELYYVQNKHDGERFQIHIHAGEFRYFSRNAYDFTETFGKSESAEGSLSSKISKLLKSSCRSIIMDGEMMGWHKLYRRFGSKGMSFDVKKMTSNSTYQPCFIAFDVIMYNEQLLVDKPLTERLKVLETAFNEEEGVLIRSETATISTKSELVEIFNASMDTFEEGIVLKKCNSTYKPAVRNGSGGYKIKAEYSPDLVEDLDLLIIGGYYGEGRFRGCINSFLVGVVHPKSSDEGEGLEFQAVSSVRTGIKIEALEELLAKLNRYWIAQCPDNVIGPKKYPPDMWIEPKNSIVLQIRATELVRSNSYPTGYSLRFPRVVAIRQKHEKHEEDVCTTKEFFSLIKDPGVIQKLTKRHVKAEEVSTGPPAKSPRKEKGSITVLNYSLCHDRDVLRKSRLFEGKDICVVNGNADYTKQEVERIVLEHGGSVVQNPGRKTFCAIVGNVNKLKVKNMIESQTSQCDVVILDWLLHATRPENLGNLQTWLPWEMLRSSDSTKIRMSLIFDATYDSYVQDATKESLERSLEKAGALVGNSGLTTEQYEEINMELFGSNISPFSLFRGMVGYICSEANQLKQEFCIMGGKATTALNDGVTHVFVRKIESRLSVPTEIHRHLRNIDSKVKVLDEQWIIDCFQERKLLPEVKYMVETCD